jgi:phosphopantetheinyl transferase (holo-ACP synthase)
MCNYFTYLINDRDGLNTELKVPSGLTAIRQTHWRNSRAALLHCIKQVSTNLNRQMPHENLLAINDFHSLKEDPSVLVSIAHTRGAACASALKRSSDCLGIGVDIENSDRVVRSEIHDKFINQKDIINGDFLKAWTAKEASFKACSYFWKLEKTFVLKDIRVNLEKNTFEVPQLGSGKLFFETREGFLLAVAILRNLTHE